MRWSRALLTGASSGLGRLFATTLAAQGCDVVLVARNEQRLAELAGDLRERHRVAADVLPADLTAGDGLALVEERLRQGEQPIDLLVNSAGMGTVGRFDEMPLEGEIAQVRLNVLAPLRLTHAALPGMVERRHGGVLNVASFAGFAAAPYWATYGGTKAFVVSFTEALHEELRGTRVTATVLCPGFARTEFQERAGFDARRLPRFAWSDPQAVVDAGLTAVGRGRAVAIPGAAYKAVNGMVRVTPRWVRRRVAGPVVSSAIGLGARRH